MGLTAEDMRRGCLYLHRRGIEMTANQLMSAERLDQDIIVRKLASEGKPTLVSDREFFGRLKSRGLPY